MAGHTPYLLNSNLDDDSAQLRVNLTNPDLFRRGGKFELPRDSIQIERSWVLANSELCHRLMIHNYAGARVQFPLELFFGVDFVDVFEVRGVKRERHGELLRFQDRRARGQVPVSRTGRGSAIHRDRVPHHAKPA